MSQRIALNNKHQESVVYNKKQYMNYPKRGGVGQSRLRWKNYQKVLKTWKKSA